MKSCPSSFNIMPPTRSKKTTQRIELYKHIETQGLEMSPCSRCAKYDKKCLVAPGSSRCSECVKIGGRNTCDVHGPSPAEWEKLDREEKKLAATWEAAQREQLALFERLAEQQAKLLRLDKQRTMFRTRAAEMLRRGLKTLEELDAVEEAEQKALEARSVFGSCPTLPNPEVEPDVMLDPSSDRVLSSALSDFDPSDPFWVSLGVDDGMSQEVGRSEGVS